MAFVQFACLLAAGLKEGRGAEVVELAVVMPQQCRSQSAPLPVRPRREVGEMVVRVGAWVIVLEQPIQRAEPVDVGPTRGHKLFLVVVRFGDRAGGLSEPDGGCDQLAVSALDEVDLAVSEGVVNVDLEVGWQHPGAFASVRG